MTKSLTLRVSESGTFRSQASGEGAILGLAFQIALSSKGKKQRPSQKKFEAWVEQYGGEYYIIDSVDTLYEAITEMERIACMWSV